LRNGEEFEGVGLAYFERRIARFEVIQTGVRVPVTARMGDNPALDMSLPGDGLAVVVHETQPSFVTYQDWEKFDTFAVHKDFGDWRVQHDQLGFGDPPFKERYTRYAKALMAVGDGAGSDTRTGMLTEFVALTNPYAPGFDGVMRVALHYGSFLRENAQVEVFDRAPDGTVSITLHRTDANGVAAIPVRPGHEYLFDAVVLEPIGAGEDAVWDTFWAALTFAVPD